MSLYKLHIKWKEKNIILKAKSLDMTHPYFVSIKDLVFTKESSLIIDPGEDDVRREFGDSDHLMFPFQIVQLIEEIKDEKKAAPVKEFKLSINEEAEEKESP